MRRTAAILAAGLASGLCVFAAGYLAVTRWSAHRLASADDLDWFRQEFRLTDAELARVRQLHEGYLPKCRAMCDRIADKQRELHEALAGATNLTAVAETKLAEAAALRAQCQAQMLRHFCEVSQAMPPEQGRRYLAEMERLTLGSHEQIERSMSGATSSPHGHH